MVQRLLKYALSWKSGVTLVLVIAVGAHCWQKLLLRTAICVLLQIVELKSKLTATYKLVIAQCGHSSLFKYSTVFTIVAFPLIAVSQFKQQSEEKPRTQRW